MSDATRPDDATRADRDLRAGAAPESGGGDKTLPLMGEELSVSNGQTIERGGVGKEHVETISDKIRRQQVEVERLGPDGKVISKQQPKASK